MIIKIDEKRYLEFDMDTEKVTIHRLDELKAERSALTTSLAKEAIADKDLLAWAKTNYQFSPEKTMVDKNKARIAELDLLISQIEEVKNG